MAIFMGINDVSARTVQNSRKLIEKIEKNWMFASKYSHTKTRTLLGGWLLW